MYLLLLINCVFKHVNSKVIDDDRLRYVLHENIEFISI